MIIHHIYLSISNDIYIKGISVVSFLSFSFINLFSWPRVPQWANILLETSIFFLFMTRDISSSSEIPLKLSIRIFIFSFFSNTTLIFFFFFGKSIIIEWLYHAKNSDEISGYILIFIFKLYIIVRSKKISQFWHDDKNYWVVRFFSQQWNTFLIIYTYFI